MKKIALFILLLFMIDACSIVDPITDDDTLDGKVIVDPSLANNPDMIEKLYLKDWSEYRISTYIKNPTQEQLQTPVIIAVHGFTASTYEWLQFRAYADTTRGINKALVSLVLMGGHGRDYETFKGSSWEEWTQPILDEYSALKNRGYKNISFAGSSTGGAILLNEIEKGRFNDTCVNQFFLIDPIVIPGNRLLTLIDIVGPILGNDVSKQSEEKRAFWYSSRPQEALNELLELIVCVRKKLEDGFTLFNGSDMKVYKAKKDGSADPIGALMIYRGVELYNGSHIGVELIDSDTHVFTFLDSRATTADSVNQRRAFDDMLMRVQK